MPGERSQDWRKVKTRHWFEKHAQHRRPKYALWMTAREPGTADAGVAGDARSTGGCRTFIYEAAHAVAAVDSGFGGPDPHDT